MRKFKILSLLILVIIATSIGLNLAKDKFYEQQNLIVDQCDRALPILTKRYKDIGRLLQLCDRQEGWKEPTISFARPLTHEPLPKTWDYQDNLMKSESGGSWDFKEALQHFNESGTPFQKIMGALSIEAMMDDFMNKANEYPEIKTSSEMKTVMEDCSRAC